MEEEIILKGSRKVVIKRFFVYKCKLSLELCYLADMSIKLISLKISLIIFTEWFQIRKEFIAPFDKVFP